MQQRGGRIEQASELVCSFTPTIVDGLLQTPDSDGHFQKIITDPADIADYDQRHTLYSRLTVVGDAARAVLARLAGEYRDLA